MLTPAVMLNKLGFLRLATGDRDGAYELFSRGAIRGGLRSDRDLTQRAILLANLAVVAAALGRQDEAISWANDALAMEELQVRRWCCLHTFHAQPQITSLASCRSMTRVCDL